jgi:DTW domain-containing protein YfiP
MMSATSERTFIPRGMNKVECPKCGARPYACTKHYGTSPNAEKRAGKSDKYAKSAP